jgi:hypothetical protein
MIQNKEHNKYTTLYHLLVKRDLSGELSKEDLLIIQSNDKKSLMDT